MLHPDLIFWSVALQVETCYKQRNDPVWIFYQWNMSLWRAFRNIHLQTLISNLFWLWFKRSARALAKLSHISNNKASAYQNLWGGEEYLFTIINHSLPTNLSHSFFTCKCKRVRQRIIRPALSGTFLLIPFLKILAVINYLSEILVFWFGWFFFLLCKATCGTQLQDPLMYRIPWAAFAMRAHSWFMFNLTHARIPMAFSAKLLSSCSAPSKVLNWKQHFSGFVWRSLLLFKIQDNFQSAEYYIWQERFNIF